MDISAEEVAVTQEYCKGFESVYESESSTCVGNNLDGETAFSKLTDM